MTDKIILPDSPEAATYVTDIQGWMSRDGKFYGAAEETARWAGCTHTPCWGCGAPTPKGYVRCSACRNRAERARYEAKPRAEWDGKAMLYSLLRDEYYHDLDQAEDHLDNGETLADMMLVICEPNYARTIDEDFFAEDLPSDEDLPRDVLAAMDSFNKAVAGIVLSWSPGRFALKMGG